MIEFPILKRPLRSDKPFSPAIGGTHRMEFNPFAISLARPAVPPMAVLLDSLAGAVPNGYNALKTIILSIWVNRR